MSEVAYSVTAPWALGAWRPGWPSVAVVALLPAAVLLGADRVPFGGVAVVAGALWWHVATLRAARATLEVGERHIRCGTNAGTAERTDLSLTTLVDLRAVTAEEVVPLLETGKLGRANLATAPFVADPVNLDDRAATDVVGVITFNGRGKRRTRTLLPIWDPAEARPFVAAAVAASPNIDSLDDIEVAPPAVQRPPGADRRTSLAALRGRLLVAIAVPVVTSVVVWAVARQVRAVVLDPLFGTTAGLAAVTGFRLLELTATLVAVVSGTVAATALVAWHGSERPITVVQAWQLGAIRSVWALWQLRLWVLGTAALLTVTGVVRAGLGLSYAVATLAIPGVQVARELVKRTDEEARTLHPEPLVRVARAHQWVAVVAALGTFVLARP